MLWIIERILERLLLKSALQMGAQKEAEMELAEVEGRAELLRRAETLEKEKIPGFEALAARLRRRAEQMESGSVAPGTDVLAIAEELRTGGQENGNGMVVSGSTTPKALPSPTGKKRGRPRKAPLPEPSEEETSDS
jgi:hypothetical protein